VPELRKHEFRGESGGRAARVEAATIGAAGHRPERTVIANPGLCSSRVVTTSGFGSQGAVAGARPSRRDQNQKPKISKEYYERRGIERAAQQFREAQDLVGAPRVEKRGGPRVELDTVRVEGEGVYVSVEQLADSLRMEIKALSILLARSRMKKHLRGEDFADGAMKALTAPSR
jgi:hypothetical protein